MIIKTLFLVSFMIASALASEKSVPIPAALLVQSNFDYSLTRKDFRVHYGGLGGESTNPTEVSIKIYNPNGEVAHTYKLSEQERKTKKAFHFALDDVEAGVYKVEVCEDTACSEKTPSVTDVTLTTEHTLSCKPIGSTEAAIDVQFIAPSESDWAKDTDYTEFAKKIRVYRSDYKTDNDKFGMGGSNPFYEKARKIFHTAIMHDLKQYRPFFGDTVDEYCGRKHMLSLHSHIVDKETKKVVNRSKTVNHLSNKGIQLFILEDNGRILLESTHENVDIPAGDYEVLVSLCVTDKDTVESTYCASPIKKDLKVNE